MCNTGACLWQLYALVDQISSNVMTATVSWAASSVTASETAPMERTKSAVKTVRCVCSYANNLLVSHFSKQILTR